MIYLRVKNWSEFQHYKDRNPPWIKLHRALLDDYEFERLQDASKAHLILIWLFASQREGRVPKDPGFLKKKLGLKAEPNLQVLIDQGFLIVEQDDSESLAASKQLAPRGEDIEQQSRGHNGKHRIESTVPDAFHVTEEMWSWAEGQGVPHARIEPETEKFLDHHKAKGSKFRDWNAAWKNWMRNSVEFSQARKH